MAFRIIGDLHGNVPTWLNLTKNVEYSLQIGDFGFDKDWKELEKLGIDKENVLYRDPSKHLILPGNHDCYPVAKQVKNYLGDYGVFSFPNNPEFFFVRGAYSVDKARRIKDISWWEEEELTYKQCLGCLELYEKVKPKIVISHDAPWKAVQKIYAKENIRPMFGNEKIPSRTEQLLTQMLSAHVPQKWYFGHHHIHSSIEHLGCKFYCTGINCSRDIKDE